VRDAKLTPVAVRAGINDGVVVAVLDGMLQAGDEVATGTLVAGTAAAAQPASSSPLLPRRPSRNPQGGRR
jgi:hypothetical protein